LILSTIWSILIKQDQQLMCLILAKWKKKCSRWEKVEKSVKIIVYLPTHFINVMSMNLVGEYECNLDTKGRLLFPAGLKKQLPSGEDSRFVINRGFEQCLVIYPGNEWNKISNEINQLNLYARKNREFVRFFYRGATELNTDGSNRLLIPKPLLQYAEITKEIILFAFSNRIEIWDKNKYQSLLTDEPEDFARLAEEVMSKKDNKDNELIP
jgi:MraZ protein